MANPKLANLMKSYEDAFADTPAGSSFAASIASLAAARSSYNAVARQARADAKAKTYEINKMTDSASAAALLYMAQQMQSFAGPASSSTAAKKTKPAKKPAKSVAAKQSAASSSQSSAAGSNGSKEPKEPNLVNDDAQF